MQLGQFQVVIFIANLLLLSSVQSERRVYETSENRPTIQLSQCDYLHVDVIYRMSTCCNFNITLQVPGIDSYLNQSFNYYGRCKFQSASFMIDISRKDLNVSCGRVTRTFRIDRELQTLTGRAMIVSNDERRLKSSVIDEKGFKSSVISSGCNTGQTWKITTFGAGGAAIFFVMVTLFLVIYLLHVKRTVRSLRGKATKTDKRIEMQNIRSPEPRWNAQGLEPAWDSDQYGGRENYTYENTTYALTSNETMHGNHFNTLNCSDGQEISKSMCKDPGIIYENISNVNRSKNPTYVNQLNMEI